MSSDEDIQIFAPTKRQTPSSLPTYRKIDIKNTGNSLQKKIIRDAAVSGASVISESMIPSPNSLSIPSILIILNDGRVKRKDLDGYGACVSIITHRIKRKRKGRKKRKQVPNF